MSEYQPANENKRHPRKKARELPADPRHHQGNLAPHPGGFDATYQQGWHGQGFDPVAFLQDQAQIRALPRYAANETLGGPSSGPTAYEEPPAFSQQTFPNQNESSSFWGPPFDNFNHVQQQTDQWCNEVWDNVSSDWNPLVQSSGMEMTEPSSNGISASRDQQVDETELDLDNSYFGLNHDAGPLPVSPSANGPCTTAQTLEPGLDMDWTGDPRSSDMLPSSETSMSLPSFGQQDMDFDYIDLAQDNGVMSMPQGSEPWSVANTRGNGSDPILVGQAATHHIDHMDFPASFELSSSATTYSQNMYDGSSTHNTIPPVSETTFDEFNAEIDEMISSLSTIKDTSADQQASRNSMANNEGVAPGRLYSGQGRQQVPEIRFWVRTDTPSRTLGVRHVQDTVV
ncbi:hypothetical protein E8E11_005820 [Didymella keratinophila]|nr:hypothetical protein E8E11_005820 [Didymella keratinophila]